MNNITAIIIAKNEEERISDCLKSVDFCKQRIVIDNGSSDKTVEIVRRVGAEVFIDKTNNFAEIRNAGLKKAKGEWVLYIDADERISPELANEIEKTVSSDPKETFFLLQRKNFYFGNHPWPKIEYMPRLFKKTALKGWHGELHESPIIEGPSKTLDHYLLHYTHRNLSEMVEKTIVWSEVEAQLRFNAHHPKITWWRFPRVMLSAFFDSYIRQQGWKAGKVGIIESMYQAFSMFITYARLWEMQQQSSKK